MRQARELKDVGVTSRDADDTLPVTADQQRHVLLNRPHSEILDVDPVMFALELCCPGVEQRTQDDDGLLEPRPRETGSRNGMPMASCSDCV